MPLVSVILPNYNHAAYLPKRIESILNQTFQNFELIVLDDLSQDRSREIIENYRNNPKISHIVFNETNSGSTFKQWEKGVFLAKGKYIWLAESDDFAENSFLENMILLLEQNPSVGIAFSESYIIDEKDKILGLWKDSIKQNQIWQKDFVRKGKKVILENMIWGNIIPNASAAVFRKEIFEKVGKEHQNFRLVGDWLLWVNMLKISDLAFTTEPLNYFRKHSQNVRSESHRTGREVLEMIKLNLIFFENLPISPFSKRKMLFILVYIWAKAIREKRFSLLQSWEVFKLLFPHDRQILGKLFKKLKPNSFPPKNMTDLKILLGEVLFPHLYQKLKRD